MSPKISIITINLNNAIGLKLTIESVMKQNYPYIEFIIIDGGSTDQSIDIINYFCNKINYWLSEKDNGIFHAMNKGINVAQGEYCLFLNSGDYLADNNTISSIFFNISAQYDIIYCNSYKNIIGKHFIYQLPEKLSLSYLISNSLAHQSTFIRRSLFSDIGLYSEEYKFCADWDFFIRVYLADKFSFKHINIPVSVFDTNGKTNHPENTNEIHDELKQMKEKYFHHEIIELANDYYSLKKKYSLIESSFIYKLYNFLYSNFIYKYFKYKNH